MIQLINLTSSILKEKLAKRTSGIHIRVKYDVDVNNDSVLY